MYQLYKIAAASILPRTDGTRSVSCYFSLYLHNEQLYTPSSSCSMIFDVIQNAPLDLGHSAGVFCMTMVYGRLKVICGYILRGGKNEFSLDGGDWYFSLELFH